MSRGPQAPIGDSPDDVLLADLEAVPGETRNLRDERKRRVRPREQVPAACSS